MIVREMTALPTLDDPLEAVAPDAPRAGLYMLMAGPGGHVRLHDLQMPLPPPLEEWERKRFGESLTERIDEIQTLPLAHRPSGWVRDEQPMYCLALHADKVLVYDLEGNEIRQIHFPVTDSPLSEKIWKSILESTITSEPTPKAVHTAPPSPTALRRLRRLKRRRKIALANAQSNTTMSSKPSSPNSKSSKAPVPYGPPPHSTNERQAQENLRAA